MKKFTRMELFSNYASCRPDPRKNIKREKKIRIVHLEGFLDVGGDDRQGVGVTTVKDEEV